MLKWRSDLAGKPLSHFMPVPGVHDDESQPRGNTSHGINLTIVWAATHNDARNYALLEDRTLRIEHMRKTRSIEDVDAIAHELASIGILATECAPAHNALPEYVRNALLRARLAQ